MAFMPGILLLLLAVFVGGVVGYLLGRNRASRSVSLAPAAPAVRQAEGEALSALVRVHGVGEGAVSAVPDPQLQEPSPADSLAPLAAKALAAPPAAPSREDPTPDHMPTEAAPEAVTREWCAQQPAAWPGDAEGEGVDAAQAEVALPGGNEPAPKPRRRSPRAKAPAAIAPPPSALPVLDDLKQVRGIGPRLEGRLATLGITRLSQMAAWSPEEAARIGTALGAPGRPEREDWAGQARRIVGPSAPPEEEGTLPLFPELEATATEGEESGFLFPELAVEQPAGRRRRR